MLTSENDTPVHGFLNGVGYINPSTRTDEVKSLKQSNRYTLNYYGYPVPLTILLEGETEERRLDSSSFCWHMHSEFKKGQSVLVLEYTQPWGDHIKILFLSYRNGDAVLLDTRRGQGRKWIIEAKKTIEATKVGTEYRWKGRNSYKIYTSDIYELVSQLASAEYDQQKLDVQQQIMSRLVKHMEIKNISPHIFSLYIIWQDGVAKETGLIFKTSKVIATAKTPSLKASRRLVSLSSIISLPTTKNRYIL